MNLRIKLGVTMLLLAGALLACSGLLFAVPLSVLIVQESEKIADSIRAFNKDYPAKPITPQEQEWHDKRVAIAQSLAGFIILANEELDIANEELDYFPENPHSEDSEPKNNPSFDAWKKSHPEYHAANEDKETLAWRKNMQLHIRWAGYWINCLGRDAASECKADKAALEKENYPFGRPGIMDISHPTHEGDEEAKHWHSRKVIPSAVVTPKPRPQPD